MATGTLKAELMNADEISDLVRREIECISHGPGGHSFGAGPDEQPEDIETIVLSQCSEGHDSVCLFHISTNMEMFSGRQGVFESPLE